MSKAKTDARTRALHEAYASGDPQRTSAIYDGWSGDYEAHMAGTGYAHPAMVAALLARHLPPGAAPLLDAGCGSGIMGEILTALGYGEIAGLDASEGMLARAREKGFYQDLRQGLLGEPLSYADDTFAAAIACGVFTEGHAPLDGLEELVRIVRPGGLLVFSISRSFIGAPFEAKADALEAAGRWRRLDASLVYNSTPLGEDHLPSQVHAFCVL